MKKKIVCVISIVIIILNVKSNAQNIQNNSSEIIQSQSNSLDISTFLNESKKYSTDILEGIDISNVLKNAISGNINDSAKSIGDKILNLFFKEILKSITSIISIILIIIIHSIIKSISDNLKNESISQITYYVTYILIVAIIMKNFADVINMIKESIENLVGFMNCLIPILMTLVMSTRKYYYCNNVTTNNLIYNSIYRKYYY